jgi:hypothetical protein
MLVVGRLEALGVRVVDMINNRGGGGGGAKEEETTGSHLRRCWPIV